MPNAAVRAFFTLYLEPLNFKMPHENKLIQLGLDNITIKTES